MCCVRMSSKGTKRLSLKRKSIGNGGDTEVSSNKSETKKDFCPLCQMPLDILIGQTEAWHFEECFAVNRVGKKECPRGISCNSTIASHYFKETHLRLAAQRCNKQADTEDNAGSQANTGETSTQEATTLPKPEVAVVANSCLHGMPSSATDRGEEAPRMDPAIITRLYSDGRCKLDVVPPGHIVRSQPEKPARIGTGSQAKITSFFQHSGPKVEKRPESAQLKLPTSVRTAFRVSPAPKTIILHETPDSTFQSTASGAWNANGRPPRRCPFYKKLVDVPFVVDAFSYGVIPGILAYFLSHFHSDHYMGLNSKFAQPLFCSQVTANLVKLKLRVSESVIHPLPLDEPHILRGVEVTLIEANHCPGAVMFLFRYTDGRYILHTGDFRADPAMEGHPTLTGVRLDVMYLDTTYCKPNYDFPSQQEVLTFIVQAAKKHLRWHANTLIVCGAYTIGKEKVFLALAETLQRRVWASREKLKIFKCLEDPALQAVLSTDQNLSGIHVLSMQQLNFKCLQDYLDSFDGSYSSLLAIKPTGWEHGSRKNVSNRLEGITPMTRGNIAIYGVPYSEHSSFGEMRRFVQRFRPSRVIPTVNVAGQGAKQQMEFIREWMK